eukprot:m.174101 g.174101  ORF g.174101 m.174101 type:complete len:95 (+) comp14590_c0_seq8:889-1173(+)
MRSGLSLFLLCHSNWRKEFEKWFPACVVEVLHGAERATLVTKLKAAAKLKHSKRGFDVILTTYEVCNGPFALALTRARSGVFLWLCLLMIIGCY